MRSLTSRVRFAVVVCLLVGSPVSAQNAPDAPAETDEESSLRSSARALGRDLGHLVETPRLVRLLGGLAVGGAMANSDVDQDLYDDYRDWSAGEDLADLSSGAKVFGEAAIVLPLAIVPGLILGLEETPDQRPVGRTWRRTARAYLIGAPTLYYVQQLTGGERPGDPEGSSWRPFEGNHGLSGHAFLGAVPFLTVARQSDNRWAKAGAIALSTLPAWSRVEDGDHYWSQVALGWLLAWEVTGAVAESGDERRVAVMPLAVEGGGGVRVSVRLP
jgi:hypothetical protein